MQIKQKSPLLPIDLALGTFGELLIMFSTKVNLLFSQFDGSEVLSSTSNKGKLYAKTFFKNSNLTKVSLYLFSLLELIRDIILFLSLPGWLKRS